MNPEGSLPPSQEPPPVPILSHINPIHAFPYHFLSHFLLFSHLQLGLPSGLFPSGFPTKILYAPPLFPIRATFSAYLFFFELITRIKFDEQYRSLSSPLYTILHSLLPRPSQAQIFSSTLYSQTPSVYVSPSAWVTMFLTHIQKEAKL